jgi:hydroxymethylbilane synthase
MVVPNEVRSIVVGTRGSALARTQTNSIVARLRSRDPRLDVTTRVISTEGDRVQDVSISQLGDKGVFVRAIEVALLRGEIDLAVHSLKDVPSDNEVTGLRLGAFSERVDARDVLVSRGGELLRDLPTGSAVGTGSLRRRAQLAAARPDLQAKDIRGNVDTRLKKLRAGEYDALILAAAGLIRLGLSEVISQYLPVDLFTPDAGQGILAIQTRSEAQWDGVALGLDDHTSRQCAIAERSCVRALGADCRSPVAAYARVDRMGMILDGMAAREDGSQLHRDRVQGAAIDAEELGAELGVRLLNTFR